MSLVWRKIQRSNKKAAKFSFEASFKELSLQCTEAWTPGKLCLAWAHRRRRVVGRTYNWEPSLFDSFRGTILWPAERPETLAVTTTLYRQPRDESYEAKEWTFLVEEVSAKGRHKAIAAVSLNLPMFITAAAPVTTTEVKLKLRPLSEHVAACTLQLVLTATILRVGGALDDDMMSIASSLSRTGSIRSSREVSPMGTEDDIPGVSGLSNEKTEKEIKEVTDSMSDWVRARTAVDPTLASVEESPRASADEPPPSRTPSPIVKRRDSPGRKRRAGPNGELIRPDASAAAKIPSLRHSKEVKEEEAAEEEELVPVQSLTAVKKVYSSGLILSQEPNELEPVRHDTPTDSDGLQLRLRTLESDDLLDWVKAVTTDYGGLRIENLCESFRSGLAFCAIIHAFRPDLLDYDELLTKSAPGDPTSIKANCSAAFSAGETLGVQRLLKPDEFVIRKIPDKIAIITYVYELRKVLMRLSVLSESMQRPASVASPTSESVYSFLQPDEEDDRVTADFLHHKTRRMEADALYADTLSGAAKSQTLDPSLLWSQTREPSSSTSPRESQSPSSGQGKKKRRNRRSDSGTPSSGDGQSPLMSRTELVDPLQQLEDTPTTPTADDSGSPLIRQLEGERRRGSSTGIALPSTPIEAEGRERDEELKRKAKEILNQFTANHRETGREATPEEAGRERDLRERAKMLIKKASSKLPNSPSLPAQSSGERPSTLPRGFTNSAPTSRQQTPDPKGSGRLLSASELAAGRRRRRRKASLSSLDPARPATDDEEDEPRRELRRTGSMKIGMRFYQYSSNSKLAESDSEADLNHSPRYEPVERPGVPALRAPSAALAGLLPGKDAPDAAPIRLTVGGRPRGPAEPGTLDRLGRWGSMRGGELASAVSRVSEEFQRRVPRAAASVPKDLSEAQGRRAQPRLQPSHSSTAAVHLPDAPSTPPQGSARLLDDSGWEAKLAAGRARLESELSALGTAMAALDARSVVVEKEWRAAIEAGAEAEQPRLQNAFVAALNERNLLVRREEQLQILLTIQEKEAAFLQVQGKLRRLSLMEETEKTEGDKRRIDALMNQLILIVNEKDQLVTRMLENEQGTEEDESLPNQVPIGGGAEDQNCAIM